MMAAGAAILPAERIENAIFMVRGHKVMLDVELARLYEVETKNLNKAVKRNRERFPEDFMFQLTREEAGSLRFQTGTSKSGRGGRRTLPYAFTEQGVAMLSTVLRSRRAVLVNIEIMRAFVKLRRILESHKDLAHKLEEMEKTYDAKFRTVFAAIRELMSDPSRHPAPPPPSPPPPPRKIGF
jgi:hypothetical protein